MAAPKPIYDLTLLLDLGAADELRSKIVDDTRAAIGAEGELLAEQAWGTRQLAYEIGHREAAEYHLLQFSGPPTLIASLEHSLRITDGVVRHRVIKLPPGSTALTSSSAPPAAAPVPAAVASTAAPATESTAPAATESAAAPAEAAPAPAEAPAGAAEAPSEAVSA